ncbi:MAG: pantoate--beta-alanine ligase [Planctomycetes bacterium]|nr:pantoate--beta-alanine ligase [Planctomycetota bacterium]
MTATAGGIAEMRRLAREWRAEARGVGLVPTMGALHDGHMSLVQAARDQSDRVVVSIFVNPIQFGPGEDYDRYPRTLEADLERCQAAGVDVVFLATAAEMYPPGYHTHVVVEDLTTGLCGAFRPGHFRGVATVVAKLLHIVAPQRAYFGEKDYQQLQVVRHLVADLNMDTEVVACPTVRESDGLALSSRNALLTPEARPRAPCLYRALCRARDLLRSGERSATALQSEMRESLERVSGVGVDYVAVVDSRTLERLDLVEGEAVALGAIRLAGVRLIDNLRISV